MTISIILPGYNSENSIKYSMASVLNQSDSDWELIIINDGSTDRTGAICEEYAKKRQGIKVYHIENAGPADARNLGIQKARGEYCIFLDSDDQLAPGAIKALKKAILRKKYELVFYGYAHETYDARNNLVSKEHVLTPREFQTNEAFKAVYGALDAQGFTHPVWNKMFRTDFLKENQILFPRDVFISEDFVFNLQAYAVANDVRIIDKILYHYISRDAGSITTSFRLDKVKDIETVYKITYQQMKDWQPLKVNRIDNEFIWNLSVYINSLYRPDCDLSEAEKKQVAVDIVNNEQVKKCVNQIEPLGYRNRLVTYLLKNKRVNLLLFTGKLANNDYLKNRLRA